MRQALLGEGMKDRAIGDLAIGLIRQQPDSGRLAAIRQIVERGARIDRAGGIVGRIDDDGARPRGQSGVDLDMRQLVAALRVERHRHDFEPDMGRRRPIGWEGRGEECDLVAAVAAEIEELTDQEIGRADDDMLLADGE